MKTGEIWLNRDKELGCTISSFDEDFINVRFCDEARSGKPIPKGQFFENWKKSPDVAATGISWTRESDRDVAASATVLCAMVGDLRYVVYVSDDATQKFGITRCKGIAEAKIASTPWLKRISVVSTDG